MMLLIPMAILAIEDEDDRAFMTRIYLDYGRLMYSVAIEIVRDPHIAEDMVSGAILAMIKDIDALRKINSFRLRSYIASIVRNDSIDYVRKRNRQGKYFFMPDDDSVLNNIPSEGAVDDALLRSAEIESLRGAIEKLSENERLLLTMKYVDEAEDSDIARLLGIGKDSVRVYLSRARKHLQRIIMEDNKNG